MNVIIIDDEISVRNSIELLLKESNPEIIVMATAGSVSEAAEKIKLHEPDLVFLDVEMPDGTGFDLLKKFSQPGFKVIFITGHHEYALDAIKVSALDYILKPFDPDELQKAIKKASQLINREEEQQKMEALFENINSRKVLKRVILHTADNLHVVSIDEIIRAEADSNYTIFRLLDKRKIMVSRTIKEFDELLSGSGLLRVHQSHLVNLLFVDRFVKRDGGYLLLKDSTMVPVSQNLKKKVIRAINDYIYD